MISNRHFRYAVVLGIALSLILIFTWQAASAGDNGGNALNFGGASHVVIPEGSVIDSLGTGSFTLEAWVYPRPRGGDLSIIRDHHDYSLYLNNARHLVAYVYPLGDRAQEDPWDRAESAAPIANDQWHHVASVWDGSVIQLYVDGNPLTPTTTIESAFGLTATMWLGANAFVPGQGFDGYIDEVRIWNVARTTADIRSTMFRQLVGTGSGLVGYWPFNEGTGLTTADASGQGNNGTLGTEAVPAEYPQWTPSTAPLGSLNTAYQNRVAAMWASQPNTAADGFASGLDISNVSFLQDTGDDIIFGDDNAAFHAGVADLPPTLNAKKRWARLWQLDVNDAGTTGGQVDLTFDISEAGGTGSFSPTGNYYLLRRPNGGTSADFVEVPIVSWSVTGDRLTFRVDVTQLGSEFTVGADNASPNAVSLQDLSARPLSAAPDITLVGLGLALGLGGIGLLASRRRLQ